MGENEGKKDLMADTGILKQSSAISIPEQKTSSSTEGIGQSIPEAYKTSLTYLGEDAHKKILAELKSYTDEEIKKVKKESATFSKKIRSDEDALKERIEDSKLSVIETLGLFVALFTFISIDIQVLKSSLNLSALAGFVLITLGALSFFVICLNLLVTKPDSKIKDYKFIIGSLITIFLLIGGVWLVNKNNKSTYIIFDRDQFNETYTKTVNKNSTDLQSLKDCLKNGGWKTCFN